MSHGKGPPWTGKSEGESASLDQAFQDAWDKAKGDDAPPGTYVVTRIEIEARNPIHSYSVTINPGS